ncbi:MAG: hypothetical protein QM831_29960 [Kofleriaceae bacterium]
MGSEFAPVSKVGGQTLANANYSDASGIEGHVGVPGKQTLTERLPQDASANPNDLVQRVQQHKHETFGDGGGFTFEVQESGMFKVIAAPKGSHTGAVIDHESDKFRTLWFRLAVMLLHEKLGPVALPATKEAAAKAKAEPYVAPEPGHAPAGADATIDAPVSGLLKRDYTKLDKKGEVIPDQFQSILASRGELQVGDMGSLTCAAQIVSPEHPYEKKDRGYELKESTPLLVKELDPKKGIARIEVLENAHDAKGKEVGWVRANKIMRLVTPARGTKAAVQMANVLAMARSNKSSTAMGSCFRYVKNYIAMAGGYGDILSPYDDPRLQRMGTSGKDFGPFVEAFGLEALGLKSVGTTRPQDQIPGTLLCTVGRYKGCGISEVDGDMAVIDSEVTGKNGHRYLRCYNDSEMMLDLDPANFDTKWKIIGMYQPIDRA